MSRIYLIIWCASAAVASYAVLDFWQSRNAPLHKRFERMWREDIELLEGSGKLPKPWFEVREIELIGGSPHARQWLKRIDVPLKDKRGDGKYRLEVLIVPWTVEKQHGVLVQYNLVDLKSKNMIWELGRTLILSPQNLLEGL